MSDYPGNLNMESTQNVNVLSTRNVVAPKALEAEFPKSATAHQTVINGRNTIRQILRGQDKRLMVVVGPCSIHDVAAAREYAARLKVLRDRVSDVMEIVMRVYFEKPRTNVGWKGLINDPHLDGSFDMDSGLRLARKLLLDVAEMGLPAATELLDPIVPQYIDDLICWAAIGARTTESQTHRQMASGLSMPVGYKNSTDGNLQVAIDAFKSARSSHQFLGIDENGTICVVKTRGNADGHIILRGGGGKTNYDPQTVADASALLVKAGLPGVLMVDCSHANSSKKHENQEVVWASIVDQRTKGSSIVGVMIESNLVEGRQDVTSPDQLVYGQSITDACINWDVTQRILLEGAEKLRAR
jgi:3-deoxy-7-phosphoheptulonate synthase